MSKAELALVNGRKNRGVSVRHQVQRTKKKIANKSSEKSIAWKKTIEKRLKRGDNGKSLKKYIDTMTTILERN